MHLRLGVGLVAVSCILGSFIAPAGAGPQMSLVDPAGDANYLNSQYLVVRSGDVATPVDASASADILALWFTHDDRSLTAHIQVEGPQSESDPAYLYRVQIDPGVGTNCLWLQAVSAGDSNASGPFGRVQDVCTSGSEWSETRGVRVRFGSGPDGTGVVAVTVPRSMHPLFEHGGDLLRPHVSVRNFHHDLMYAPQIDDTRWGKTYRLPPRG